MRPCVQCYRSNVRRSEARCSIRNEHRCASSIIDSKWPMHPGSLISVGWSRFRNYLCIGVVLLEIYPNRNGYSRHFLKSTRWDLNISSIPSLPWKTWRRCSRHHRSPFVDDRRPDNLYRIVPEFVLVPHPQTDRSDCWSCSSTRTNRTKHCRINH